MAGAPTGGGAGLAVGTVGGSNIADALKKAPVASAASIREIAFQAAGKAAPTVRLAIFTVAAAYGTMYRIQWQSADFIVCAHLMAEKPKELRSRSANYRGLLYTRETVPHEAGVGHRYARRRSLEATAIVAQLCREEEASMESVLKSVCQCARDAGIMAFVPSGAIAAPPV